MIRKPPSGWEREPSRVVETVRGAGEIARGSGRLARRGGHVARGLFCFFFAAIWGFAALAGGLLSGDLISFVGIGGMAAFMAWAGRRAFAKARELSS